MLHVTSHTRCDLAVWHKSVYPTSLARLGTRACMAIFRAHERGTRTCVFSI
ncbi:hypothetical protein F383_08363 [Gossypium arboreum]|uniref:Uncharacterized protein n=1 Tax=Gossypium arboreum TaxID=29729 RepID=A0A0B0P5Z6_GOSAR|nr:hypothetical protein F383_04517 [Gossypium arboreum]KHG29746.1 hypothetical protein F383_08363 [Gossypium arboreum]